MYATLLATHLWKMRMSSMGNDDWFWDGKKYQINYNWDMDAWHKLWLDMDKQEKKNTREVIDNELMALDLLECLVDDSANQDAVNMLAGIGIHC